MRRLTTRLKRYLPMTTKGRGDLAQVHSEHSLIINCMLDGDKFGAELAMKTHIHIAGELAKNLLSRQVPE